MNREIIRKLEEIQEIISPTFTKEDFGEDWEEVIETEAGGIWSMMEIEGIEYSRDNVIEFLEGGI